MTTNNDNGQTSSDLDDNAYLGAPVQTNKTIDNLPIIEHINDELLIANTAKKYGLRLTKFNILCGKGSLVIFISKKHHATVKVLHGFAEISIFMVRHPQDVGVDQKFYSKKIHLRNLEGLFQEIKHGFVQARAEMRHVSQLWANQKRK